jgi:hypothetical protein
MTRKARVKLLPATDPNLHYPISMSQAERESLAGEARLAELLKKPKKSARNPLAK